MKKTCTQNLFKRISKPSALGRLKSSLAVMMVLVLFSTFAFAQNAIKVTGVVKDSKGITLPGVSVKVKGTTLGAQTDIDGKFSVNVPNASAVLVFSYVGYTTK